MKAIIDGDVLIYRAAWKAEKTFNWGNDLYSIVADLKEARGHYQSALGSILDCIPGPKRRAVVVVSDPKGTTFRNDLWPAYKANRHKPSMRKPIVFKALREELLFLEQAIFASNLEGDDLLGILHTQDPESVICTIDKDLRSIPGVHLNFDKKEEGIYRLTETEAEHFFLEQAMAGDPTDGIPGIPGIGMRTARKILTKNGYCWETVRAAYEKAKLSDEHALTMARLVRILDVSLYDESKSAPILWSPTR